MVSLSGGDPFLRADLPEIVVRVGPRPFPARHHPRLAGHPREGARAVGRRGLEAATVTLDHADARGRTRRRACRASHARALLALCAPLAASAHARLAAGQREGAARRETLAGLPGAPRAWPPDHGATVSVEPGFPLPCATCPEALRWRARLRDLRARHPNLRMGAFFLRPDRAGARGRRARVPGRPRLLQHRPPRPGLEVRGVPAARGPGRRPRRASASARCLPRLRHPRPPTPAAPAGCSSRGEVEGLYTLRGLLGGAAEPGARVSARRVRGGAGCRRASSRPPCPGSAGPAAGAAADRSRPTS